MITWKLILNFFLTCSVHVFASTSVDHLCRLDQRDALLELKKEFYVDSYGDSYANTMEKWSNNSDCCLWDGVHCDSITGKVVELNLRMNYLNGPLRFNSSLFKLQHLQSLNLDYNNFSGSLPDSIGNLKYLEALRLSYCNLSGKIPTSLGNLSHLTHLQLDSNSLTGELPDSLGDLYQLTYLSLGDNMLTGNFRHMLLNLSSLTHIDLRSNQFEGTLPSNMSSLSKLEDFLVYGNSFSGSIPSSLFMIPSMANLYLSENHFDGFLDVGNISSPSSKLQILLLGENNINEPIPGFLSKLVGLLSLDLVYLNTRRNNNMVVDLSLLSNLTSLENLDLSGNNLKISSTLYLPSPIKHLYISSCSLVEFPKFLRNQTNLVNLDISANQIGGQVPEWLWSVSSLHYLNISHNSFTGFQGPADVIRRQKGLYMLDISSNTFQNPFPLLPNFTLYLSASDNRFSGEIPRSICELSFLNILVLSGNNFSGSIPRCFENFNTYLSVLHLWNNSLSGYFPEESISVALKSLDVGHNQLSGRLPKSLANCTRLEFLNVEHNRFNDTFPSWLRSLPNLQILVLRSNEFYGLITHPGSNLRIFDISENRFSGVLPSNYFATWTALSSGVDIVDSTPNFVGNNYHKSVMLINKGLIMELVWSGFAIYKVVDVSGNIFEGDIPESICFLKALIVLNMSNNAFTGLIPPCLANLTSLESLDLSQNGLSGGIPPQLGKLTFLARMNFSYNKLEGPIPQGTQIQSQDKSSFVGNPGLCGVPLHERCGQDEGEATKQAEEEEQEEEEEVLSWIAAAIAYVPGVFCGLTIAHILASYEHDWFIMKIFRCST